MFYFDYGVLPTARRNAVGLPFDTEELRRQLVFLRNGQVVRNEGTIQGYPLLQVRKLVRALSNRLYWDLKTVQAVLSVGPAKAREMVEALEATGLSKTRREKGSRTWTTTQCAQTFASATAAKPITRQTAERALAEFLSRVDCVNSDDRFLAKVIPRIVCGRYRQCDKYNLRYGDMSLRLPLQQIA